MESNKEKNRTQTSQVQDPIISQSPPSSALSSTSILTNSFFQVSINSEKLAILFKNIDDTILEQNKKIDNLAKDTYKLFTSVSDKIEAESKKNSLLFSKVDLRINESSNTQYCYVMDCHKKSEQRDQQLGKRIEKLQSLIGKVEDTMKEDLNRGLIDLKKQIIGDVKLASQYEIQDPVPLIQQNETISPQTPIPPPKIDFNYIIEHFQQQIFKLRQCITPAFDELYQLKQQEKKKKHTQDMLNLTYQKQIDGFKENMKGDQNYLKIIYPSNTKKTSGAEKDEKSQKEVPLKSIKKLARHMSFNRNPGIQEQILHGYNQLLEKLEKLEHVLHDQNHSIAELKNKEIVLDEKVTILNRKMEKNSFETAEVKTTIRRVESQKLDDKIIEELRNYIKWAVRDLQDKIGKKCSDEDLQRQKHKLSEKISILHQNLIEKADKGQIQKALVFLEGKIKQIIFLIAAEHTEQKQGAIMKTAAKCLSCDKEVQRQIQAETDCKRELNKQSQGQYIKSMTHRVRQRYKKQMAKTLGNQTFDN